ncbi:MAG: adenylosuccinate lyase [Chloroflexi bacterium]|nr:adenylosuccinate lyase [Chloroflexota bacterium]
MPNLENYQSPFSWRYSSPEMRALWGETNNRITWRRLWVILAEVQAEFGLVNSQQLEDLQTHAEDVDLERSYEIESQIQHDLMAELKVFAEQCSVGGGIIHLGATSMDIKDNADVLRTRKALDLVLEGLRSLLLVLAEQIIKWADLPLIAYTHLQPAEPSTLGFRLAQYAQDLLTDWRNLSTVRQGLRGKGFRGAVGTGAAFADLLGVDKLPEFEKKLAQKLNLNFFPVSTQTYPRKQDYEVISALAGLGGSLYKFAFDLRVLQSPSVGELAEPFGSKQVGSSAMPFKRNPIKAEKINSLGRQLAQLPRLAWDNASHSLLERTLDDSANRRTMLPEAFLISDELLHVASQIFDDLHVDTNAIARNLDTYSSFAATERVLTKLVKAGADRQIIYAILREHSLTAWQAVRGGALNPLADLVCEEKAFLEYFPAEKLKELMSAEGYIGDAPQRARRLARDIQMALGEQENKSGEGKKN